MRQYIRKLRQQLTNTQQHKVSINILHNILKNKILSYQKIAIYLSYDGEVQTNKIIKFLRTQGCDIYLPIIKKDKLKFGRIGANYKLNRFGIKEPKNTKIINSNQLNLIIMPLVGFDNFGNRIGMGSGFYDKSLRFRLRQKQYKQPKLYGLAFNFQQIKITPRSWDIQLDKIIISDKFT